MIDLTQSSSVVLFTNVLVKCDSINIACFFLSYNSMFADTSVVVKRTSVAWRVERAFRKAPI